MPDILNRTVKTPAGDAPVVPILILSFGAYLTWFGVHYWRSDTAWPSDPLKAVLTGKPIPVPDRSAGEAAIKSVVSGASGSVTETGSAVGHSPGAGATASVMTKEQIMALWTGNGGSASTANVAAAVALAESSGRTGPDVNTHNPDGGTNVGLWQLDTKGVGAGHTIEQLQDPATNARITIMGSANGTNWSHWEAHTNGAYKKYL
jgi:hypothetical protein